MEKNFPKILAWDCLSLLRPEPEGKKAKEKRPQRFACLARRPRRGAQVKTTKYATNTQ